MTERWVDHVVGVVAAATVLVADVGLGGRVSDHESAGEDWGRRDGHESGCWEEKEKKVAAAAGVEYGNEQREKEGREAHAAAGAAARKKNLTVFV